MYDLQRADLWKRISAWLFDIILLVIAAVGAALLLSAVLGYDSYSGQLEDVKLRCEKEYGVELDVSEAEYDAKTEEERALYDEAYSAFSHDEEAVHAYGMMVNLTFLIVVFAILFGTLLLEFLVPLLLGNGQTVGKKIFGIGVMREDGVKLTPMLLFIRTVLGKYTVETMIPVMILLMFWFGTMGILGLILILAILVVQVVMVFATRARTPIHDKLAHTVTVDLASQKIFDTPEDLLAYKQRIHAARAQNADY
ncbi:MAG: RDD family protein [Clostridia bacterium]|nr:RDD family protein [Clostridia bacterium]